MEIDQLLFNYRKIDSGYIKISNEIHQNIFLSKKKKRKKRFLYVKKMF